MRLLLLSVDYLPRVGGISYMTHHLANTFTETGHDVTVVAPGAKDTINFKVDYQLVCDNEARLNWRSGVRGYLESNRIRRFLNQLDPATFDHILLMHPFFYGPAALAFGREHNIPVACYFHGYELRSQILHQDHLLARIFNKFTPFDSLKTSTIRLVREVDEVLVNSHATAELVSQLGQVAWVTGCGLSHDDLAQYQIDQEEAGVLKKTLRQELLLEGPVIGFLGRLSPSKNVNFLIQLLCELDGYQLVVCGDGPERLGLEALTAALGLTDRVRFTGEIDESLKWQYLAAFDLLCVPSIYTSIGQMEGFCIAMLEASIRRTPVCVSRHGGMKDFVGADAGIYLEVEDPDISASAIRQLLEDKTQVERCVDSAVQKIEDKFNYRSIADQLVARWKAKLPD